MIFSAIDRPDYSQYIMNMIRSKKNQLFIRKRKTASQNFRISNMFIRKI